MMPLRSAIQVSILVAFKTEMKLLTVCYPRVNVYIDVENPWVFNPENDHKWSTNRGAPFSNKTQTCRHDIFPSFNKHCHWEKKHFGRGKSSTFLKDFLIAMLEYPMIFCWWKGVLNCPWGPMKIQDVPEATPARPSCFMVPRMAVTTWGQGSRCQPKFTTFGLVLKHEIPAHNSWKQP